jgi:outer membrane receptor for ferrienterochelin and colicins
MRFLYFSFLLFLAAVTVIAQNVRISGVVLEENSKGTFSPIVGAPVFWLGTSKGVVTDTNGVFTISQIKDSLNPHYSQLVIQYLGYKSDTILVKGNEKVRVILVQQNSKELSEVTITEKLNSTFQNYLDPLNTKSMSEKELFKAACCNLSESFETNPSVDVNFSDAITGAKQIQMLGLSGNYVQMSVENMTGIRGLGSAYGLSYLPGPWISSIQVTKGLGSVVNGYESMTGQINIELKKSEVTAKSGERVYANAYANNFGRVEANLNLVKKLNKKWSNATLMHADYMNTIMDFNKDNFMDMPMGKQFNLVHRWKYEHNNWMVQLGGKTLIDERNGGQYALNSSMTNMNMNLYTTKNSTKRGEFFAKIGYVFPEKKYKSMGLQLSGIWHDQNQQFGNTNYISNQQNGNANLIYQSIIGNTNHKYRVGLSFMWDNYNENASLISASSDFINNTFVYKLTNLDRKEIVGGAFGEYTWTPLPKFTLVSGLRIDQTNLFGTQISPRLHAKYNITENTQLRFSGGRGFRTSNFLMDNVGLLVSNRAVVYPNFADNSFLNGAARQEISWNYGFSISQDFKFDYRKGNIVVDVYRTDFQQQIVADLYANVNTLKFEIVKGNSYANSFQIEANYELQKRLDLRLAYRYYDIQTLYSNGWEERPFISKNRFFINLAYETRTKWKFDATANWNGQKRLPPTAIYQSTYSPDFVTINAQISKSFGNEQKQWFDVYLGSENLTGFRQDLAIINSSNPFKFGFDAAQIYAPITGTMFYLGGRYKLK